MADKRIIEYEATNTARTDDNLLMDSAAMGTRKITATNLLKPAMDEITSQVGTEETARQSADTTINNKIGNTPLPTTAQTITGALDEIFNSAASVEEVDQDTYDDMEQQGLIEEDVPYFIPDGEAQPYKDLWDKVGSASLDTTAQDLSGAVNELAASLVNLVKTATLGSITTTSLGLYVTNLNYDDVVVIGGKGTHGDGFYCTPTRRSNDGKVILKCTDDNNATIKSKTVTNVEVYYLVK